MTKKKIENEQTEKKILKILDNERISLSIKKIKELLNDRYSIDISPQIVKRYLLKLEKENKIIKI